MRQVFTEPIPRPAGSQVGGSKGRDAGIHRENLQAGRRSQGLEAGAHTP